jgi:hypothetical protein
LVGFVKLIPWPTEIIMQEDGLIRRATDVNETIVMTVVHMDYKGQVAKRINENATWQPKDQVRDKSLKILLRKQWSWH